MQHPAVLPWSARQRRERALAVAALVAVAWYTALCAVQPGRPSTPVVNGSWLTGLLLICTLAVVRARRRQPATTAFAVAVISWTAGECVYLCYPGEVPFPSVADGLYLAFYPAAYVGLGRLLRARVTTSALPPSTWLDGLVGVLAGGATIAWLAFEPLLDTLGGDPLTIATNLAYPLCDLLLVLLAGVLLVVGGRRAGPQWALLLAGFVMFGLTDSAYLVETALGTYTDNTLLDPGWALGLALVAGSSLAPARTDRLTIGTAPSAVPVLGGLVASAVLLMGSLGHANRVAVVLAAAAVVVAFSRLLLTLREVRALLDARRLSLTDELTGLPNRRALLQHLDVRTGEQLPCTLVLFDLDGFKELNDTLGHAAGDELLRRVGQRMLHGLRDDEVFCRLGGDEFALMTASGQAEDGVGRARDLLDGLDASVVLDGVPVRVGASAGVASSPADAVDTSRLMQAADVALYQAKSAGGAVQRYQARDDHHSRDRLAMAAELVDGIREGQLRLLYQPQARLSDGRVVAAEALVRWQHPVRGLLTPDVFLPVVQATGVVRQLTDAVLHEAARQAVSWRRLGVPIAVNLAGSDLLDPELPARVRACLAEAGATPADLRLEVTEDAVMGDVARAVATLHELRAAGLHLGLDDFGQGHSSLARLRDMPLDEIKIDRAFLWHGPDPSPRTTSIVRAAVALGRDLGLTVVAEGLEDPAVWAELARLGCDTVQGYALSRPVDAASFERWHASWRGVPTVDTPPEQRSPSRRTGPPDQPPGQPPGQPAGQPTGVGSRSEPVGMSREMTAPSRAAPAQAANRMR